MLQYGQIIQDVSKFHFLKSASLLHNQETQFSRATIFMLMYDDMKLQLKIIHGSDDSSHLKIR